MIPIKIQCGCGQKYAFDVEPVNGRMGTAVACPVCGTDGTAVANEIISQTLASQAPPPPRIAGLRIGATAPAATADVITRPAVPAIMQAPPKATSQVSLGLGILGALLGAAVGIGVMYGFFEWAGFRFPLLGVGIGVLTGLGARILARGTDSTLGIISGVIALLSVVGTLYLMYGEFPIMSIISVAVSVSFAYRISSS